MEKLMAMRRPWICIQIAVISLLVALPSSLQLPSIHARGGVPFPSYENPVGLVSSYQDDITALIRSGDFELISIEKLYGRTFYTCRFRWGRVIYVMSGPRRLNAGITVQILMDTYNVSRIIQYGTAGSASTSLSYGDVSVPKAVFYTGCWRWLRYEQLVGAGGSTTAEGPQLHFQTYGTGNGDNLLEGLLFKPEVVFSMEGMEKTYGVNTTSINEFWVQALQNLKLGECVGATCVDKTPKAVFGLQGSTSDIFVDNKAYSEYLAEKFKVSTVDQESAAIAMAAKAGGVPVNVVLGVSDLAGGDTEYSTSLPSLPATNALIVSVGLVDLIFPWLQSVV